MIDVISDKGRYVNRMLLVRYEKVTRLTHTIAYSHCIGMGMGPVQGTGTDTIINNESLPLSQTNTNISTWYYPFHLMFVPM